jgi:group II intron reverse transcriptase/maturase
VVKFNAIEWSSESDYAKSNRGAAGVDGQTIQDFDRDLSKNLYLIWNRMSSGSYFPPSVKAVPIPKKSGGERLLGVPTVSDRIAQTVVTMTLEPILEPILEPVFHVDSYGYRRGKSPHDALAITRKRCWERDWVLEYDIRGLFDHIDHELLLKALDHHCSESWVLLYVRRWLTAPMQTKDGKQERRNVGTPQGGPLSPVLANLFLHYALDRWLTVRHPDIPFCRYADDGILRCRSEREAQYLHSQLDMREVDPIAIHRDAQQTSILACVCPGCSDKSPSAPC